MKKADLDPIEGHRIQQETLLISLYKKGFRDGVKQVAERCTEVRLDSRHTDETLRRALALMVADTIDNLEIRLNLVLSRIKRSQGEFSKKSRNRSGPDKPDDDG